MTQLIKMSEIHYDQQFNCRGEIIPMDVVDLAKDIEKNGLLQPVVITKYSEAKAAATGKKYLLVAGYRRFTAYNVLRRSEISATVLETMEEVDACFLNLSENTQRKDLNITQEARAMQRLFDLGIGEFEVAERLGKSRGWVQVRYMLLKLPEEIKAECSAGIISQTQIRDIYTHFKAEGKLKAFDVTKRMKDAQINGNRSLRIPHKKPVQKNAKRHRKRPEIFTMMEEIQNLHGNSLATRALAWAAGEISDNDLMDSFV